MSELKRSLLGALHGLLSPLFFRDLILLQIYFCHHVLVLSAENFLRYGIKLSLQEKHATYTNEVTMNQHNWPKRSLIGERNHSAENPRSLNG